MACCLTKTGVRKFSGKTGSVVTIKLGVVQGNAEIVHLRYAGTEVDATSPFQFKIKSGVNVLVILMESSKPVTTVQMIEECDGAASQVLESFDLDSLEPARVYVITGSKA